MIKYNGTINESTVFEQSTDDKYGAYSLMANPELYEVQRSNHFSLEISLTTNSKGENVRLRRWNALETDSDDVKYFQNPNEVLRISVVKSPIPSYGQGVISLPRGNTKIHYAGKMEYDDSFSITMDDFIGAETKEIILSWQALSGNINTQKVGHASDYKKTAFLTEFTPDNMPVRKWKIEGCWIKKPNFGEYSHEGNGDKVQVTADIVFDRCYPVPLN